MPASPYQIAGNLNFGNVPSLEPEGYGQAYSNALELNKSNYSNILAGYQQLLSGQMSAQQAIAAGYGGLTTATLGDIQDIGASQQTAINKIYAKEKGDLEQEMIAKGLGNLTVKSQLQRGVDTNRDDANIALANQMAQLKAGYRSQLGQAGLNQANASNMQNTALGVKQLDFMNSVNAPYPNAANYYEMLKARGASDALARAQAMQMMRGGGGGGTSGLGTPPRGLPPSTANPGGGNPSQSGGGGSSGGGGGSSRPQDQTVDRFGRPKFDNNGDPIWGYDSQGRPLNNDGEVINNLAGINNPPGIRFGQQPGMLDPYTGSPYQGGIGQSGGQSPYTEGILNQTNDIMGSLGMGTAGGASPYSNPYAGDYGYGVLGQANDIMGSLGMEGFKQQAGQGFDPGGGANPADNPYQLPESLQPSGGGTDTSQDWMNFPDYAQAGGYMDNSEAVQTVMDQWNQYGGDMSGFNQFYGDAGGAGVGAAGGYYGAQTPDWQNYGDYGGE